MQMCSGKADKPIMKTVEAHCLFSDLLTSFHIPWMLFVATHNTKSKLILQLHLTVAPQSIQISTSFDPISLCYKPH